MSQTPSMRNFAQRGVHRQGRLPFVSNDGGIVVQSPCRVKVDLPVIAGQLLQSPERLRRVERRHTVR